MKFPLLYVLFKKSSKSTFGIKSKPFTSLSGSSSSLNIPFTPFRTGRFPVSIERSKSIWKLSLNS
jgi:hypothetical protein